MFDITSYIINLLSIGAVHPSSETLSSQVEMTVPVKTEDLSSSVLMKIVTMKNYIDHVVLIIDTVITAVVSSITVLLLALVLITSVVAVIFCIRSTRKIIPGTRLHAVVCMHAHHIFFLVVTIEPNPAYEIGIYNLDRYFDQ